MDEGTILLWALAVVLVIAGLAGLFLPGLPGPPLLFAGLWLAAWAESYAHVGAGTLIVLAVLAAGIYIVDFAAVAMGARRFGASKRALAGAGVGLLIGLFLGLPGVVLGPLAGAVIAELAGRRDLESAARAGLGAAIGLAVGVAVKVALSFVMIGIFLADRIF
jgi:uncharacterized protein YqgC (DUF456 family)